MRLEPRLGEKLWFSPQQWGWGWWPISWEGWAVTVAAAALGLALISVDARWLVFLPMVALIAACVLKGTSPGDVREWEEWQEHRRADA